MSPEPRASPFIVTIDGPAGAGKSTTARAVARRLGFVHLDSGALYRAYTYVALRLDLVRRDGSLDHAGLPSLLGEAPQPRIRAGKMEILWRGRVLDRRLRTPRVTAAVSAVAALREVRERVNRTLRALATSHGPGFVCEGRDMGSQVYPDAALKIFLTADPYERARRRLRERGRPATRKAVEEEARRLLARDARDATREASPFRRPPGAVDVDTTHLRPAAQVARIVELACARGAPRAKLP